MIYYCTHLLFDFMWNSLEQNAKMRNICTELTIFYAPQAYHNDGDSDYKNS